MKYLLIGYNSANTESLVKYIESTNNDVEFHSSLDKLSETEKTLFDSHGYGGIIPILIESDLNTLKSENSDLKEKEIVNTIKTYRRHIKASCLEYKTIDYTEFESDEDIYNHISETKFIVQVYGNIPSKTNSHTRGWACQWAKYLKCQTTNNAHDIARSTVLYVDHGVNFGGSFNLFGGITEKVVDRLTNITNSNSAIYSLEIDMPDYAGILPDRLGKNSTSPRLTPKLIEDFTQRTKNVDTIKMNPSSSESEFHVISDSHGASVARRDTNNNIATVDRTNGKTLHNFVRTFDVKSVNGKKNVTLWFGNIDIRHHVCRHDKSNWEKLVDEYMKIAYQLATTNGSVTIVTPYPIEFEGRKLPKTGYYKDTPFYGSIEDRTEMVELFAKVVDKRISDFSKCSKPVKVNRISLKPKFYEMNKTQFATECMEFGGSVHISPLMYIDNNCENWQMYSFIDNKIKQTNIEG